MALVGGFHFQVGDGFQEGDGLHLGAELPEEGADDEAGVGGAEAEVGADPVGDVRIGPAVEADFFRGLEDGFVKVRRGPAQGDAVAGLDGGIAHHGIHRTYPADVGEGGDDPDELLGGGEDQFGVGPQGLQGGGMLRQITNDPGDGVDDGIASAGKGEIGKSDLLFPGQGAAFVFRLEEAGEKVFPGAGGGFVEFPLEIGFQHRALGGAVAAIPEDMHTPADPEGGLGFRHVQQISQGAGLQGQGETSHDLDGVPGGRRLEERSYQVFDPFDEFRLERAAEDGLHDFPVTGVLRGIGLDGQLAHPAHVLLGGNGHAEGGIRAEGLPILRRLAHVLELQKHGDGLAAERGRQHGVGGAQVLEGIAGTGVGHGGGGGKSLRWIKPA